MRLVGDRRSGLMVIAAGSLIFACSAGVGLVATAAADPGGVPGVLHTVDASTDSNESALIDQARARAHAAGAIARKYGGSRTPSDDVIDVPVFAEIAVLAADAARDPSEAAKAAAIAAETAARAIQQSGFSDRLQDLADAAGDAARAAAKAAAHPDDVELANAATKAQNKATKLSDDSANPIPLIQS
ncbi:hypothetical protein ACFYO1_13140 [Nocardia sp. NPDC006044]|uniref:hypothetical protein n=1 Tax=Nocardia sp. NPDC006044 TaxID=3364306 RepID=UPI0036955ED4